jgi:hypothetical protein
MVTRAGGVFLLIAAGLHAALAFALLRPKPQPRA